MDGGVTVVVVVFWVCCDSSVVVVVDEKVSSPPVDPPSCRHVVGRQRQSAIGSDFGSRVLRGERRARVGLAGYPHVCELRASRGVDIQAQTWFGGPGCMQTHRAITHAILPLGHRGTERCRVFGRGVQHHRSG